MGRQLHATLLNPFLSQRLVMVTNKEHHSGLERLAAFAVDGSVASFIDRPFALRDAADAVGHPAAGRAGKFGGATASAAEDLIGSRYLTLNNSPHRWRRHGRHRADRVSLGLSRHSRQGLRSTAPVRRPVVDRRAS